MKDRQRFADALTPAEGPSLSKLAGFRDALMQPFRTKRSAIPGATQDQATGFLYLTH
jgi:hypothetical protein